MVIVLAGGKLQAGLHPDDHSSVYLPAEVDQNGEQLCRTQVSTAREAFNISYPAWYRDASTNYIPSAMADVRINLTAALYCFHLLPTPTNQEELSEQVINVLRASWKKQAILFPSKFQFILCHQGFLANCAFVTTHAGLLFPIKNGYTYLEKTGGNGPFMRLDFDGRTDLLKWLAGRFGKASGDYIFATFRRQQNRNATSGVLASVLDCTLISARMHRAASKFYKFTMAGSPKVRSRRRQSALTFRLRDHNLLEEAILARTARPRLQASFHFARWEDMFLNSRFRAAK